MSGNSYGKLFTLTTFGESHGEALGGIIDGMPSNIYIDQDFIKSEMDRRKPGGNKLGTQRKEDDSVRFLSGIFNGYSTGTPIAFIVENSNQHSSDYDEIKDTFRPGHADETYQKKYGIRDYRGGGRSSGRETLSRVVGGALAKLVLKKYGIEINAGVVEVGGIKASSYTWNPPFLPPLFAPKCTEEESMIKSVEDARRMGDSLGSVVECHISGVPVGLGEPVFDKLDARLSSAIFSLGAVKGFEIGSGFEAARKRGSENNDQTTVKNGKIVHLSNNAGGILGGISNGEDIIFKASFKPTPSISIMQHAVTKDGEEQEIIIKGRHDPVIGPRAVVVVEAMASLSILDELLINNAYSENGSNPLG